MATYNISLTPTDIRTLAEKLRKELDFSQKVDIFCSKLAEIGVSTASIKLYSDPRSQGTSISLDRKGSGEYLIVASGEQVGFIEFGVGVVGESGGYENVPSNWVYNAMWSPWAHDDNDPTLWYYKDETNTVQSTRGTLPVAFMHSASTQVKNRIKSIAKEVFR